MTSPTIDLMPRPDSPNVHWPLPTTTTTTAAPTTTTKTTTLPLPPQPQQGPSDPILIKRMGKLEEFIANLVEENLALEKRLDKQGDQIHKLETIDWPKMIREQTVEFIESQETDRKIDESVKEVVISSHYDKGHAIHRVAYEALQDSIRRDESEDFDVDKAQEETKKKSKQDSPNTPPGSPPLPPPPPPPPSGASGASNITGASDSAQDPPPHLRPHPLIREPSITTIPDDLYMDDETTADEQAYSSGDEASALKSAYALPSENSLLAQTGDMAIFMDWYCKRQGITHLTLQDLEGPAFEIVKVFHPDVIHLQFQMEECHKLLTDQVDDTILRPALSISKMKAAYYPDVGLEQLVPDQFWIEEECKYDITAMYGISHWWFQRQRFYIDRFSSEGDRRAVRTHMRILSVVRIEVFSMYGYNYMKKIVLRRADLKEYVIAERDFKYMYPSDFEDLYLLNLQGYLNHLSPKDKKILTTAVNLWTRNLVIRQRVEAFQLGIENSPRAVIFRDKYRVQMIMRFNEIHKFSDGNLQQIDEALDYRVKEFQINGTNPGMNTRFWMKKDVDRSKSVLTDQEDQAKMEMETPRSSRVNSPPNAHS
ncbi:hypothetical protein Tco_0769010 [Tanacetum coccineum]|uniref:Uncharacterized protein n=1 Tax=Tanacetum coccineum TaxID=301880 RepID=A0ABQ4Z894_9ASTR